jgi:hypothetical protein
MFSLGDRDPFATRSIAWVQANDFDVKECGCWTVHL